MTDLDMDRIRREQAVKGTWARGRAAIKAAKAAPRCECGHVQLHHGLNENPCSHVGCKCKGFTDAAKCPVCLRRYAKTSDGVLYCRTCNA